MASALSEADGIDYTDPEEVICCSVSKTTCSGVCQKVLPFLILFFPLVFLMHEA